MKNSMRRWLEKDGEEFLRKIGIRRGQIVLDFGCGSGNYAIPAARIVRREGRVYALDKKSWGIWPGEGLDKLKIPRFIPKKSLEEHLGSKYNLFYSEKELVKMHHETDLSVYFCVFLWLKIRQYPQTIRRNKLCLG